MPKYAALLLVLCCTACGSHKAVRPSAPTPVIAETQSYSISYESADGKQRITADYANSDSPPTVSLHQGSTVEKLKQIQAWTGGVEYSNYVTRWHVQDGFATLNRNGKQTIFNEIAE